MKSSLKANTRSRSMQHVSMSTTGKQRVTMTISDNWRTRFTRFLRKMTKQLIRAFSSSISYALKSETIQAAMLYSESSKANSKR